VEVVGLTPTQRRVLVELALTGASDADIGASLGMATKTVKTHMTMLRLWLGLDNRTQLAIYAWRAALEQHHIVVPDCLLPACRALEGSE